MLRRLLRTPRADLEVAVAIPVGCMVPLAIAAAVLVGAGVLVGQRSHDGTVAPADRVTVRVIDDGAPGGPRVLSTGRTLALMPDRRVNIFLPGFPHCPTCGAEAHVLTFRPEVESDGTRVLAEFARRCPNEQPVIINMVMT